MPSPPTSSTTQARRNSTAPRCPFTTIPGPGRKGDPFPQQDDGVVEHSARLEILDQAGDRLVLAFYARLEKGENGATSVTLPFAGVQLASDPYTPLFNQPVVIGPEWKLVQVSGAANKDYAAGTLKAAIHLATAKQVIDFGPVAVIDLGKAK